MKKIDYEQFAGKKCQELIQIQERFRAQFELGNYQQWYYDAELALLRLYNNDGDQIYLKYIPIGTFLMKRMILRPGATNVKESE
ncbi:DUF6882 domain-containing protein [Sphingobacterium siyangense]|uniref:DUF6882 domain-containing protein n=1 Tax=Sphingobacterium TaxID=28453 RepID=UPI00289CF342|nr:DUF6882 domain-containing protein [Sphingobacterium siyangense]